MLLIASILVFDSLSSRNLIEIKIDLKLIYINKCVEIAVATIYYLKKITYWNSSTTISRCVLDIFKYNSKWYLANISAFWNGIQDLKIFIFHLISLSLVFGKCKRLESAENFAMLFFEKDPSFAASWDSFYYFFSFYYSNLIKCYVRDWRDKKRVWKQLHKKRFFYFNQFCHDCQYACTFFHHCIETLSDQSTIVIK